jgi:SdpC family antimicrobial peptide
MWQNRWFTQVMAASLTAVALMGCGTTSTTVQGRTFTGQEIFVGLFFGEGEVGGKLPELWEGESLSSKAATPAEARDLEAFEARIVADLERSEPGFLDRFGTAMQSGDHVLIAETLNKDRDLIFKAIEQTSGASNSLDVQNEDIEFDAGGGEDFGTGKKELALYKAIALKSVVPVKIAVEYAIMVNKFFSVEQFSTYSAGYSRDYYVDLIATRLSH